MVPSFFALMVCLGARLFLPVKGQTDPLPAASISFEPENTVYILGESVTIRCGAPSPLAEIEYTFYKDGVLINRGTENSVFLITSITDKESGSYFCRYERRVRISLESPSIKLSVTSRPPTPSISFLPPVGGVPGARVLVNCITSDISTVEGYRFYRAGRELTERNGSPEDTFIIPSFEEAFVGTYVCLCFRRLSGREIRSAESNRAYLTNAGNDNSITVSWPMCIQGNDNTSSVSFPVCILAIDFYLVLFGGKLIVLALALVLFATCLICQKLRKQSSLDE